MEVDVITSAAPNASVALKRNDVDMKDVFDAMAERIDRILYVAFSKHIDTLILGAYGCGVFGNDPEMVASLFASALNVKYRGCFNTVYFAIPRSKYNNNYNTFSIIINRFIDEDGYLLPVDDELLSQATFDISDYEDEDDEV